MAEPYDLEHPLRLTATEAEPLTPHPLENSGSRREFHPVRSPSFVQPARPRQNPSPQNGQRQPGGSPQSAPVSNRSQPAGQMPFGAQFAGGKRKFPFQGLFEGVAQPLEKLKDFSIQDMKLDDLLLIGLVLLLLHEQSDYDILLVLAYLFIIGL